MSEALRLSNLMSSISLLGELVYYVTAEVGPILRAGVDSMNPAGMRQGYCLGLVEVILCSPKKQLKDFVERFVVEDPLCHALPEVRHAAGDAFVVIHKIMGYRSTSSLHAPSIVKSREVLPYLAPRLLTTPTALTNIQVIVSFSGAVLHCDMDYLRKSARSIPLYH
ncbi:hypothetical protein SDRG_15395 [Saprolegnia diclina VS20]|uniref:Uncharacterized protein n=1 Tax=Saprolegnia diclina (strain VS20) TaxID=1156394 RepID=T0Q053_SAPDV|nr:hypothetical protein SDRG_15395 [Saprolegnia diclina VS20]EQC26745.1 hypothetical protein SDRG_15395 [Saprolegnia diclina VS20]|eukprot:XP_008619788.1 hypothetical protein SDRG_15395 [Saprolegnia diclina VS20]